jgi:hypothetical protein
MVSVQIIQGKPWGMLEKTFWWLNLVLKLNKPLTYDLREKIKDALKENRFFSNGWLLSFLTLEHFLDKASTTHSNSTALWGIAISGLVLFENWRKARDLSNLADDLDTFFEKKNRSLKPEDFDTAFLDSLAQLKPVKLPEAKRPVWVNPLAKTGAIGLKI